MSNELSTSNKQTKTTSRKFSRVWLKHTYNSHLTQLTSSDSTDVENFLVRTENSNNNRKKKLSRFSMASAASNSKDSGEDNSLIEESRSLEHFSISRVIRQSGKIPWMTTNPVPEVQMYDRLVSRTLCNKVKETKQAIEEQQIINERDNKELSKLIKENSELITGNEELRRSLAAHRRHAENTQTMLAERLRESMNIRTKYSASLDELDQVNCDMNNNLEDLKTMKKRLVDKDDAIITLQKSYTSLKDVSKDYIDKEMLTPHSNSKAKSNKDLNGASCARLSPAKAKSDTVNCSQSNSLCNKPGKSYKTKQASFKDASKQNKPSPYTARTKAAFKSPYVAPVSPVIYLSAPRIGGDVKHCRKHRHHRPQRHQKKCTTDLTGGRKKSQIGMTANGNNNNKESSGSTSSDSIESYKSAIPAEHTIQDEESNADNTETQQSENINNHAAQYNQNNNKKSRNRQNADDAPCAHCDGQCHNDIKRLQLLIEQRELQHKDFMQAFNDAILAKEAALSTAEERKETIYMLEVRITKLTQDYERMIQHKNDELKIKDDVIAAYKQERYSLAKAFEQATKCMLAKLNTKNNSMRKMNAQHHDQMSQLRSLVLELETDLNATTATLNRLKMFQERELQVFNYKIKELHDLLKQKEAELNNYQQISADIVNMAEKMNLDLHVKEDIIKNLNEELSNFHVGINEVEGDRVLIKQNKVDKRVISLGFPRIVDGSLVIWYKSRSHGDNFLVLKIFGGKVFIVEKKNILPELNRILPNLLNSPNLTHAALKLDRGTQCPPDPGCRNPPSAMQAEIHVIGKRAHLAVQGRHLCSQRSIMFTEADDDIEINKEIIPRPYTAVAGDHSPEKAILLTELPADKKHKQNKKSTNESDDESEYESDDEDESTELKSTDASRKGGSRKGGGSTTDEESDDSTESSEENETSNARVRNLTQNARTPPPKSTNKSLEQKVSELSNLEETNDLAAYTDKLLRDLKKKRETILSASDFSQSSKLEELPPLVPESNLAHSLRCIDDQPIKSWKNMSLRDGLREVEAELDDLIREQRLVGASGRVWKTSTRSPAAKDDKLSLPTAKQEEAYDWSIPDFDLPEEFYKQPIKREKASHHGDAALDFVECSVKMPKNKSKVRVLKSELEETQYRAAKIGEDYQFTRLTSDSEERIIEEETIRVKAEVEDMPEIIYNEETRRFEMGKPQKYSKVTRKPGKVKPKETVVCDEELQQFVSPSKLNMHKRKMV